VRANRVARSRARGREARKRPGDNRFWISDFRFSIAVS
jgi:hypothetical protein